MASLKYQAVRSSGLLPAIRNCQKKHDSAGTMKLCLLGLVMIFVNSERIIFREMFTVEMIIGVGIDGGCAHHQ